MGDTETKVEKQLQRNGFKHKLSPDGVVVESMLFEGLQAYGSFMMLGEKLALAQFYFIDPKKMPDLLRHLTRQHGKGNEHKSESLTWWISEIVQGKATQTYRSSLLNMQNSMTDSRRYVNLGFSSGKQPPPALRANERMRDGTSALEVNGQDP